MRLRYAEEKEIVCFVHSELPVLYHRGFVRLRDQMYLIEPLAGTEAGQQDNRQNSEAHSDEGLHAVYNYKHLRRKRSSCSHGNTTTFYDHGAHPSGLFQLSSLVKTHSVDTYTYTPGFEACSSYLISSILCYIVTFNKSNVYLHHVSTSYLWQKSTFPLI